ncbi:predicted protein [Sclerotinia sclerotiorum 1980 UF-70]|uniref:Uncharacterized protein n=1 Tax=Sclerotinia sclerotiorum (strain ATCC 18683 / 1980 / Ss-1) TaxID=665079 RepID=A7EC40_SCLS1|nr:predicted protein [Sclerotinia sclerotiorum 1980 UF-70]EDO00019.1 predicted protein [Sclerotinia sclerotiorum 1980 UF-70]
MMERDRERGEDMDGWMDGWFVDGDLKVLRGLEYGRWGGIGGEREGGKRARGNGW